MIAALRNAAVAAIEGAGITGLVVTNGRLDAPAKATRLGVNVSVITDAGVIGAGAAYAAEVAPVLMLECYAVGRSDRETADALDALAYACLRALLVTPSFRAQWPAKKWSGELYFLKDAEESHQKRIVKVTFEHPIDFTVLPDTDLLTVAGGYDVGAAPDPDAPAVSDQINVGGT